MRLLLPAALSLLVLLLASPSGPCGPAEAPAQHLEAQSSAILATEDCNGNGIDDAVDIALGDSADSDLDGIPDECQEAAPGSAVER
ncbi:MAG: hypothetical protein KDC14_07545 [Planctomycetes bacterium]|nr:hypothetical protein [Planctomycetota bacterium]